MAHRLSLDSRSWQSAHRPAITRSFGFSLIPQETHTGRRLIAAPAAGQLAAESVPPPFPVLQTRAELAWRLDRSAALFDRASRALGRLDGFPFLFMAGALVLPFSRASASARPAA